jgi:3-hydroxyethyl bacteriochlorophyllide a dehydrogenase
MHALAVVLERPGQLGLDELAIDEPGEGDVVVDVAWSGISTGTERLLWSGRMPPFPGLNYPLVPGYETVGRVVQTGAAASRLLGETVFVPGARCFGPVRGLFGGAASRLVVPSDRVVCVPGDLRERAVLLALAATAVHARAASPPRPRVLVVGHGVLGRLLARLAVAGGECPLVWESDPARRAGAEGYDVAAPDGDDCGDFDIVYDVSGDPGILDRVIPRLVHGGEVVLAGFYDRPVSFVFPPAFLREARIRIAAEWKPADLATAVDMVRSGDLSLDGLITHRRDARDAEQAYRTAFEDPACLKMVLDWRGCQ